MAEIPTRYLVHTVTVEPYTGSGAYGPQYGAPVVRACMVDEKRKLVRASNGSGQGDGDEIVSEATIYLRRAYLADFPPETRVTLPTGRVSTVITTADRSDGDLGTWQHLEVSLR